MKLNRLLIANRGEIACRIIETASRRGIVALSVHTSVDSDSRHVRLSDESYYLGESPLGYLDIDLILSAAESLGADSIHAGYGFLSESFNFASRVVSAGLTFVGPSPESIRLMGSKDDAKRLMSSSGIPVVDGYSGDNQESTHLHACADELGYPLLIKAVSGGGGRGMRLVSDSSDFLSALSSARRESQNAFGDDRVLLERFIPNPRHIEFQIFADTHGSVVHLFERDCTLQRRHQKVIEESPAPFLSDDLRVRMGEIACDAARAVNYVGAGTIEFIVDSGFDGRSLSFDNFWFMEMNTRLQVEHRITELLTGIDLVDWQLTIAEGFPLPLRQDEITMTGHSLEARICAEDSLSGFLPSSGSFLSISAPTTSSKTYIFDTGYESGDIFSSHYDSLISKLIVHSCDRESAISDLDSLLSSTLIFGIPTNISFLLSLLRHSSFRSGIFDTGLIDRDLDFLLSSCTISPVQIATGISCLIDNERSLFGRSDAWHLDSFRLFGDSDLSRSCLINGEPHTFPVRETSAGTEVYIDGDWFSRCLDSCSIFQSDDSVYVICDGVHSIFSHYHLESSIACDTDTTGIIRVPFHGRILDVPIAVGDFVDEGSLLFCVEAMKMEHSVYAPYSGEVLELHLVLDSHAESGSIALILVPRDSKKE